MSHWNDDARRRASRAPAAPSPARGIAILHRERASTPGRTWCSRELATLEGAHRLVELEAPASVDDCATCATALRWAKEGWLPW